MPPVTRVALDTLGCKLNQAETETMARALAGAGFCLVTPEEQFDVYILNTCTVTGTADAKSRHLLRLAHRRSPQAALVVTGCYTESARGVLASLPGVRLVLPNPQKSQLVSELLRLGYPGIGASLQAGGGVLRTRAFVKAQEGCSNFCAYCIVPYVRGKESSRPPSDVIREIDTRVREGYKEVVLTGTEIGSYRNRQTGSGRSGATHPAGNENCPPAPLFASAAGGHRGAFEASGKTLGFARIFTFLFKAAATPFCGA